jgi:glyoxylase-like metal-dependent hydrolase (beta-lactamase superfamily II)
MLIKTIPVGHLETNCYVVTDEDSLLCAVIDPGDEANAILDYLEDNRLKCAAVLLTHGHFDHVGAVNALLEETGAQLWMHRADCGEDGRRGQFRAPEGTHFLSDGEVIEVGALRFTVLTTPGHTPGGVTYVCGEALFTGDTLFAGSCGRTDFPGGDMQTELRSLKRLGELPGDYEVYPGHMESSTLERERKFNRYMIAALTGR